MATFESLPLELRYMIIEQALPDLKIETCSERFHRRNKSERAYYRALMRIATASRSWLTSVYYFTESLQRQDDERLENHRFHKAWCIETGKWVCEERWWYLHDGIIQAMLRVSRSRKES